MDRQGRKRVVASVAPMVMAVVLILGAGWKAYAGSPRVVENHGEAVRVHANHGNMKMTIVVE